MQHLLSYELKGTWETTPLLKINNKKARLEFAKLLVDKLQSFWENALWTNEPKLELSCKAHKLQIHRCKIEAEREKNNVPAVTHGGGSCCVLGKSQLSYKKCWISSKGCAITY